MNTPDTTNFVAQLRDSRWVSPPLRGALPAVPTKTVLPTAAAEYRNRIIVVPGASGAADVFYICLKSAADAYSWKTLATG